MTLEQLVKKYLNQLDRTINKKAELEIIIREINSLTYRESGKPISPEDKRKILEKLRKEAVYESVTHFAQDNSDFLELLDATIKALGGK